MDENNYIPENAPRGRRTTRILLPQKEVKSLPVTPKEIFEHLFLFCKTNLEMAGDGICAFYIDDFPACDEAVLKGIQARLEQLGYSTSNFMSPDAKTYMGFWSWK